MDQLLTKQQMFALDQTENICRQQIKCEFNCDFCIG